MINNFLFYYLFSRFIYIFSVNRKKKTTMGIDFYYLPGSSPCRAVQMTAKAVGVDLNLKLTNLMAGEHLKPEFLKVSCVELFYQS